MTSSFAHRVPCTHRRRRRVRTSSCWTTSASIRRSPTSCSVRTPRSHAPRCSTTRDSSPSSRHAAFRAVDEFDAPRGHATHFAIWQLRDAMSNLALSPAAELQLADIADALESDPGWLTVGPADACPDNVLVTPDGLRLLDFEGAARYHALFDAGSLALPFPSCWCHDAFAEELRQRAARRAPPRARAHARRVRRATRARLDRLVRLDAGPMARRHAPRRLPPDRAPGQRPRTRARGGADDRRPKQPAHSARGPPVSTGPCAPSGGPKRTPDRRIPRSAELDPGRRAGSHAPGVSCACMPRTGSASTVC